MARILLFGASGFLGRAVEAVLAEHFTVVAPSRQECDLVAADRSRLAAFLRRARPDGVVNCAGRIAGTSAQFVESHTLITAKLIDCVAEVSPGVRLVRIGSAAEYGVVPHGAVATETDPARPVSDYGISQLAATDLVRLAAASGRVDAVVLRVFNPVGPGSTSGNVLGRAAELLQAALARGDRRIELGLNDSYRDFVDVRDVAEAVLAALNARRLPESIYNVGSGQAVATREAVEMLARHAGFTGRFVDGLRSPTADRSAAVPWMCADISRITDALGWAPRYPLSESLAALWAARSHVTAGSGTRHDVTVSARPAPVPPSAPVR